MDATGPEDTLVGGFRGEPAPVRDAGPGVDVLSEPPNARDVTDELTAPPRRGLSRVTLALAAGVLVAGGFWAGAEVGKDHGGGGNGGGGGGTGAAARAGAPGGASGAQVGQGASQGGAQGGEGSQGGGEGRTGGRGAGGPGGGSGGGATTGTVKVVDGAFIYLSDASGNIVKVRTTDTTTIEIRSSGTTADLRPGDTVVVRGTAGDDGTLAATSVTEGAQTGGAMPQGAPGGATTGSATGSTGGSTTGSTTGGSGGGSGAGNAAGGRG